jgi:acetyl-CoA carboxylase biotin carboxyl carrier protein
LTTAGDTVAELTQEDVQTILKIIDEMGDRDVHLEIGELKLHVTRGRDASSAVTLAPAPAPGGSARPAEDATASRRPEAIREVPAGHVAVRAPTIGTFYRAASPGARPFVEVGDVVGADDTVCMFEVMKLFSSLQAGVAGAVTAILVANESLVEQDQPLILIKPD